MYLRVDAEAQNIHISALSEAMEHFAYGNTDASNDNDDGDDTRQDRRVNLFWGLRSAAVKEFYCCV